MRKVDFMVRCTDSAASKRPALYKIAAEWNGGGFRELKTFGFADDECLPRVFSAARVRYAAIHLVEGESLGPLHVYRLNSGKHDYELQREFDREHLAPPLQPVIADAVGSIAEAGATA